MKPTTVIHPVIAMTLSGIALLLIGIYIGIYVAPMPEPIMGQCGELRAALP